jgi:Zn-dependent protease
MTGGDEPPREMSGLLGDFRSERPRAESPMTWSLAICRLGGIAVRIHAVFLLLIAVELLRASVPGSIRTLGLPPTAMVMCWLLSLAILHEAARTMAARRAGEDLDEWLLWPLGGLCSMDAGERAPALRQASGWLVQAMLAVLCGVALALGTGEGIAAAVPTPWSLEGFRSFSLGGHGLLWEAMWLLQWTNLVTLTLQSLPAFPLTGGRVLFVVFQRRRGWSEAARLVSRLGIGVAVALLILGLATGPWILSGLAVVAWIASRETLARTHDSDAMLGEEPDRSEDRSRADQEEIDRILAKINARGMRSLSLLERWRLRRATRRRRHGG